MKLLAALGIGVGVLVLVYITAFFIGGPWPFQYASLSGRFSVSV